MVFIFGALLEFAIVNSLMRKANKFEHLANCVSRTTGGRHKYRRPMTRKTKRLPSSKIGNKPVVYAQHDYVAAKKSEEEEEETEEVMQTEPIDNHRQPDDMIYTDGSYRRRPV